MAQQIIHKFKYDDATEIQATLAQWIFAAADDLLPEIDCFAQFHCIKGACSCVNITKRQF